MRRCLVALAVATAALAAPATAFAHSGPSQVVAVNYQVEIRSQIHGFEAHVMDGDQRLWIRARLGTTLLVLGIIREPLLRFENGSVFVNERSPTAKIDGIGVSSVQPSFHRGTVPLWARVSVSETYSWHEHRLHAAAVLGHGGPARRLAGWTIPYRLDGRAGEIAGELRYVPPPRLWLWLLPLAVGLAASALAVRTKRTVVARIGLPALTALALVVASAGRDLYGRPDVPASSYALVGITAALAVVATYGVVRARSDLRILLAFVVGVIGIYQGVVLLPMLAHGLVLAALPAALERTSVSLALAAGVATCLLYLFAEIRPRRSG